MQSDFAVKIDKKPVKNFWRGRGGFLPIAIVERMMQGSIEDAEQYFNGRSPEGVFAISAHYGIARDGRVWQFVDDEDTAWSNGVLQNPDLSIGWLKEVYQEKVNCNLVTLSIDYEGYSGEPLTPRQYESALALHHQLVQRWDIEADNQHIIGHNWIDSLERSHNPGPLFPFNQLIKDLKAGPAEAAQPVQSNPLAFLETPMPDTEEEISNLPVVETESVVDYQPETVEEPAYRPQVEAFTSTPDLNDEVDQLTEAPTEVDPTNAEATPVQSETFEATAAYQPEEVQTESTYQQEASPFEEVQQEPAYQPDPSQSASSPEVNQLDAPYQPDASYQFEPVESEATAQPETGQPYLAPQDAAYAPDAVQPETPYEPEPVEAAEQPGEVQPEESQVEATQPGGQFDEVQPEPAYEAEEVQTSAQPEELQNDGAYEPEEVENVDRPEEAPAETASQPEPAQEEAAIQPDERQAEPFDIDDIEADLAYNPKTAKFTTTRPISTPAPAQQPAIQPEFQTEAGQPVAQPDEAQIEAYSPDEDQAAGEPVETQAESVEPEAVQADNQPEVFDAPGQPDHLTQLETAAFEAAEPVTMEQAAPEEVTTETAEVVEAQPELQSPSTEEREPPENDVAEQVAPVMAEPLTEEASAEQLAEETAPEQVAPEQVAPEAVAEKPAGHRHDDWASDIFADEFTPAFENDSAPTAQEPSLRTETASTAQLEASPVIGDDITPKYVRPEFFDSSYHARSAEVEPTSMTEVFEAPASDEDTDALTANQAETGSPEPETAAPFVEPETAVAIPPLTEETSAEQLSEEAAEGSLVEEVSAESSTGAAASETPAEEAAVESPAEEISAPPVEETNHEAAPEAASPVEEVTSPEAAPQETLTGAVEPEAPAQEASPETPQAEADQTEAHVQEAPQAAPAEPEKREEKHHWYDRIKNLFGGHDDKNAQTEPEAVPAQAAPPPQVIQATPFNQVESSAPKAAEEAVTAEAEPATATGDTQAEPETPGPEAYQPDYAAEQEIFRSGSDFEAGTVEAATEPANYAAGTTAEPAQEDYAAEPAPSEPQTAAATTATQPEPQPVSPGDAVSEQTQAEPAWQPESAQSQEASVNPPVETPPAEESFYPFELDTPGASNYATYYRSGDTGVPVGQPDNYDFGLNNPAPSYDQGFNNNGPSDYPFELPNHETTPSYLESFAPPAPPAPPVEEPVYFNETLAASEPAHQAEETQAAIPLPPQQAQQPEPVIPPFSFEPEKAGEEPVNFFDTNLASSGQPKFAYDDLELPAWLNEPETYRPETAAPSADLTLDFSGTGPVASEEPAPPPPNDFSWAGGSASQENALPGWLQDAHEESDLPDWLKVAGEPATSPEQPAVPETAQPASFKDTPAVAIPNKDWQENENLFEDDDFFSLLNQSGLDLSLERGGTGTLPATGPLPADSSATSAPPPAGAESSQTGGGTPPPASPEVVGREPHPAQASSEPEFDNYFDEVETAPPPAKMTVRQLIDRNDGYTAPLSYEDLDMSVPFGLEEDITVSSNLQSAATAPAPSPAPTRADPPGFHRVDLGEGQTSVELANIRSQPSYDKETIVRVSEQGERFKFDGWVEGPELRGSTRWYHIVMPSGDHWIHSTLVQLDRPFRG